MQITEISRRMQWVVVCDSIATGRGSQPPLFHHRKAVTWVQWVKQAPESHSIRKKEPNRTELHIKSTSSASEAATACTGKGVWFWPSSSSRSDFQRDLVSIKCKFGSQNIVRFRYLWSGRLQVDVLPICFAAWWQSLLPNVTIMEFSPPAKNSPEKMQGWFLSLQKK